MNKIYITGESIKLGQLLKVGGFIGTGGQAKMFIEDTEIKIGDRRLSARGTTIKVGTTLWIDDEIYQIVAKEVE